MNTKNLPSLYFLVNEDDSTILDVYRSYESAYEALKEEVEYYGTDSGYYPSFSIIKGKRKTFNVETKIDIVEVPEEEEEEEEE